MAVGALDGKPQSASSFQASASFIPTHKASSAHELAQSKVVGAGLAKLYGQGKDAGGKKREGLGPVLFPTKDCVPKHHVVSGKMI